MKKLLVIISLLSVLSFSTILNAGQYAVLQPFPTDLVSASALIDGSTPIDVLTVPSDKHFVLTNVVSNGYWTAALPKYQYFGVGISEVGTGSASTNVIIGHHTITSLSNGVANYETEQQVSFGYGIVFQPSSTIRLSYNTGLRGYITLTGYFY